MSYLGNSEQRLGDVDDTRHLLDVADAVLDGLGVVLAGGVQDALDLLVLCLGPLLVHGATVLDESAPDAQQAEGDDGLLVDDIVLVAEGIDGQTGGGGQDGGLGDQRVAGDGIDDGLGLGLGLLGRDVGRRADGRQGGEGREGSRSDGRSEAGGPWRQSVRCAHANWAGIASRDTDQPTDSGSSQTGRHCDVSGDALLTGIEVFPSSPVDVEVLTR